MTSAFWTKIRRIRPPFALVGTILCFHTPAHAQELPKTDAQLRAAHTIVGENFRHTLQSAYLATPKEIVVWTPPGYNEAANRNRRYPVLYMLDGQNVLDGATSFIAGKEWRADETAMELINKKEIEPMIIVAISNAGIERANEYLPTRDPAWHGGQGGLASNFVAFVAGELRPFIASKYRAADGAGQTGIAGSSFGGICALWAAMQRPDVFGRAAVLSPSVWWNDRSILAILKLHAPFANPARLWLDIGTDEANGDAKENASTLQNTRDLRDLLETKGWKPGKTLLYRESPSDRHNEEAWARRLPDILRFLYPYGKKSAQ